MSQLLGVPKVGNDGVAITLGQHSNCGEQSVWFSLRRASPINLIRQAAIPSIEILPQHVRWRATQKPLEIEVHTAAPPPAIAGVVAIQRLTNQPPPTC